MSFETDGVIHPMVECSQKGIKKLKKGSGMKLNKFGTPNRLWDDYLELESYIRSNTAHNINKLDGEVPEAIMSGNTSIINQFCCLNGLNG